MIKSNVDLEHHIRKTIFNHIIAYPGVSFSTLKKIFDLNDSTLRYHLKYLERGERISSRIERGKLHYYPYFSNITIPTAANTSSKTNDLTPQQLHILYAIKKYPGINQTELITKTSLKRHILTYNISKLIDLGMVRKYNHVRNVCYEYITDELLKTETLKVLAIKLLNNEIDEETFLRLKNRMK
ncbi:MAG: MarR family transcriptional regulator [Thermoplasmata archaeon]|nr:MAG: MarR family transcriptional regulator [Thermoplasmata archaeon]